MSDNDIESLLTLGPPSKFQKKQPQFQQNDPNVRESSVCFNEAHTHKVP